MPCNIPDRAYDQAMKKCRPYPILFTACAALVFAWAALLSTPALADQTRSAVPGGEIRLEGPLKAGQPIKAIFDLKGYALPAGAYAAINVEFPVRPKGARPEVRPGYPQTVMTFTEPGTYRVLILLNQISKGSCGGVAAKPLMETTLDLDVAP
jgi:hypothetical protein